MASSTGFGKSKATKAPSATTAKRQEASKQYDKMKADGLPEFNVFIRIANQKNWFPVGSLAVQRSNLIHRAIFDQEEQLLQGAFRLFPVLRKQRQNLEYGYRLKQFGDEPIQLAVRPAPSPAGNLLQNLKQKAAGLLKRA
jgi:Family of unknown function (DUF6523)